MLRLGIDPEKLYRATFICQDGLCCCNMALISFWLFRKNLGNLRDFFGQMFYRPPWQKISRTPMFIIVRKGIKTTTTLKALRWMNKNCYLYGYISNDFVPCSNLWFCSIHTSEFCDDSADRLQSITYCLYHYLLFIRSSKRLSSLQINN